MRQNIIYTPVILINAMVVFLVLLITFVAQWHRIIPILRPPTLMHLRVVLSLLINELTQLLSVSS